MRRRRFVRSAALSSLLVVAFVLAGCVDQGADDDDGASASQPSPPSGGTGPSRQESAGLDPIWFEGLVYAYDVVHAPTGDEGLLEFVVLEGPEGSFMVDPVDDDADDPLWAWVHHWGVPPLGAVDRVSLEPERDGSSLDWFMFPIREQDTWEGMGPHGRPLLFSTKSVDVALPGGDVVPAFEVTGTDNAGASLVYTYTAEVGWFVSLSWDASGDGEPELRFALADVRVEPEWQERPVRAPVRFLELFVAGPDVGVLPGLPPGLPGSPVEFDHGFAFTGNETAYFVVHFEGEAGFYYAQVDLGGDGSPREWQWLHDGGGHASFLAAFTFQPDGTGDPAASMFVAANGTATLHGVQMVGVDSGDG